MRLWSDSGTSSHPECLLESPLQLEERSSWDGGSGCFNRGRKSGKLPTGLSVYGKEHESSIQTRRKWNSLIFLKMLSASVSVITRWNGSGEDLMGRFNYQRQRKLGDLLNEAGLRAARRSRFEKKSASICKTRWNQSPCMRLNLALEIPCIKGIILEMHYV